MPQQTPNLTFEYLLASQADKHVTLNQNLSRLDTIVQMSVLSASLMTQPSSPLPGARYILPIGATGPVWSTFTPNTIVVWQDDAWTSYSPKVGWAVFIADTGDFRIFSNGQWSVTLVSNENLNNVPRTWPQQATFTGGSVPLVLKSSSTNMGIDFVNGTSRRWFLYYGSSGATFNLNRYDVAGNYAGTPLSVTSAGVLQTEFCNVFNSGVAPEPLVDGGMALGSSGKRFSTLFATTGTINTSDAREKRICLRSRMLPSMQHL
jgi:hypothetical protein